MDMHDIILDLNVPRFLLIQQYFYSYMWISISLILPNFHTSSCSSPYLHDLVGESKFARIWDKDKKNESYRMFEEGEMKWKKSYHPRFFKMKFSMSICSILCMLLQHEVWICLLVRNYVHAISFHFMFMLIKFCMFTVLYFKKKIKESREE